MDGAPMSVIDHGAGRWRRRALWLAWATIVWNTIEAGVSIWAGMRAGSTALVGFGLDAVIETMSATVVLWQLWDPGLAADREQRALKLIGISFYLLATYIAIESLRDLATLTRPDPAPLGIAITGLSLVVMPLLAVAKRRVGLAMDSHVVLADAQETFLCTWLSAIVLGGLALNAILGWWWADPVAALGVAWLAIREGREAWTGGHHDH